MVLEQLEDYCEGADVSIRLHFSEPGGGTKKKVEVGIFNPRHKICNKEQDKWLFRWWDPEDSDSDSDSDSDVEIYCGAEELEGLIDREIGKLSHVRYEWLDVDLSPKNSNQWYSMFQSELYETECKGESWKEKAVDIVSNLYYLINRRRYMVTKPAPPDS